MLLICCITALAIVFSPVLSWADEDQELEEILDGFDDGEDAGDDLQEVIEGFDDESSSEKKKAEIEDEEILEGFDEDTAEVEVLVPEQAYLPDFLNLDGYFKLGSSYNMYHHQAEGTDTEWHGLSRLRAKIMLELDAKFSESWQARVAGHGFYDFAYQIQGRDEFTREVLNENENELEFGEVWLLGSITDQLDLKAGRQIVVWGKSDNIRVTDVLRHVSISRSTMERRFVKTLGRLPKAEIDRVRLDRVKQLLAVTDYPLAKIAELAGFRYVEGMCHLFRNTFGQTPGQYRKQR